MQLNRLWIVPLLIVGVAACQQQSSTPKAEQPETTTTTPAGTTKLKTEQTAMKQSAKAAAEVAVASSTPAKPAVTPSTAAKTPAKVAATDVREVAKTPAVETASGDPAAGARLAKGKCGACHYFDQDKKKVGPTLMGIYGRAPAIEGVPYAKWDSAALDAWLASPKAVKPKTKMAFKGIAEKNKRDNLIAYLKTL